MSKRRYLSVPYVVWIIGFTIIPLLMIIINAFGDGSGHITAANVLAIFEPVHRKAFLLSLGLALITTVICLFLSFPLAIILRKLNFGRKGFVILVLILPMWMNFVLRIMALQLILSKNGILNMALNAIGLPSQHWSNSMIAIVIGMVYDYLPFMIVPLYTVLMKMDYSLVQAAQDLGANPMQVFTKVIIPLSMPGISTGITMVFIPCVSTFVISKMLGGGTEVMIGDLIEMQFTGSTYNQNLGSAMAFVLMIIILICMGVMNQFDSDGEGKEGRVTI